MLDRKATSTMSLSTIPQPNMGFIEFLLDASADLSAPNKKWRTAFAKIYCYRTILSVAKKDTARKDNEKVSRSPSSCVASDNVEQEDGLFKIDPRSLAELVKEKNLDQLQKFNGIHGLASALKTDINSGICGNDEDVARRNEAFGSNTYEPPIKSSLNCFVEALKDHLTIPFLLACATYSLAFGIAEDGLKKGWYDGVSAFVAVFLVTGISVVSNCKQNRQFDKLSKQRNNIQIDVIRNDRNLQIPISEIVVGDVICLQIGDQVPADGLLVDGHSLQVDESSISGESDHVEINSGHNPFLFSGTQVVDGSARMLATSVGINTKSSQMMNQRNCDKNEHAPSQAPLNRLTSLIGKVGLAVAGVVIVVLLVRYFTGNTTDNNGKREFNGKKTKLLQLLNAVVVIVAFTFSDVAIPERLSLAVILATAYSKRQMMAGQAMVRKLSAIETIPFATVICTHKTGSLTLNQMKVIKFWPGHETVVEGSPSSISPRISELIHQGVAVNTTGGAYRTSSGSECVLLSSATENSILRWAVQELDMAMEEVKQNSTILQVEDFNSQKKRSGILMKNNRDNTLHVHWKGAPEMILAMCSNYYDASGNIILLDDGPRKAFERMIEGMAASSLRCIAFAHKQVPEEEHEDAKDQRKVNEEDLSLLGLVCIKDPCHRGIKEFSEEIQCAGLQIKLITGENVFTAKAIATECGILNSNEDMSTGVVVEGEEFRNYTPEQRIEKVDEISVIARASPSDKLLMVQSLKQRGHTVVVTGDDINDARVLKEAHIGFAMGSQGNEVAQESSDIVILNGNFASIIMVLRWGRCVRTNIQRFIQFQLTTNVAALVFNFVVAVSVGKNPLPATQLLWVNLIIDTLGALALATEQPTKKAMTKLPVDRSDPLITNIMWRNLLAQASYQIVMLSTLQFRSESILGVNENVKNTLIFNTFVLCQVFNEFNARKLEYKNVFEGIHKNKKFLGIVGITILLQVLMIEFLKKFADTERLNWGQWGACIAIAVASWPIGWAVKWIPVPEKPFFSYLKRKK